jgi:hypothetical protein
VSISRNRQFRYAQQPSYLFLINLISRSDNFVPGLAVEERRILPTTGGALIAIDAFHFVHSMALAGWENLK